MRLELHDALADGDVVRSDPPDLSSALLGLGGGHCGGGTAVGRTKGRLYERGQKPSLSSPASRPIAKMPRLRQPSRG
jgi:hypothetical protein